MDTWQQELIEAARVAALATSGPGGQPHVVPIAFVYDDGHLFTPLDRKPKRKGPKQLQRVQDLEHNPRAAVLVQHYEADWSRLAWIQLRGRGSVVEDGPVRDRAIEMLRAKYPQYAELPLTDRPIIALEVDQAISWRAARSAD